MGVNPKEIKAGENPKDIKVGVNPKDIKAGEKPKDIKVGDNPKKGQVNAIAVFHVSPTLLNHQKFVPSWQPRWWLIIYGNICPKCWNNCTANMTPFMVDFKGVSFNGKYWINLSGLLYIQICYTNIQTLSLNIAADINFNSDLCSLWNQNNFKTLCTSCCF